MNMCEQKHIKSKRDNWLYSTLQIVHHTVSWPYNLRLNKINICSQVWNQFKHNFTMLPYKSDMLILYSSPWKRLVLKEGVRREQLWE